MMNASMLSTKETQDARYETLRAVRNGVLIKPDHCEVCGKKSVKIDMHHKDYTKPLDIVWVCKQCHHEIHASMYPNREILHVTESQNKWLEERAKKMEISKSELMRRIIDKEKEGK